MRGKRLYRGVMAIILAVILAVITPGSTFLGGFGEVKAEDTWEATSLVSNGDFESCDNGLTGWNVDTWLASGGLWFLTKSGENNDTVFVKTDNDSDDTSTMKMHQDITNVEAGTYKVAIRSTGNADALSGINISISDGTNTKSVALSKTTAWGTWVTSETEELELADKGTLTVSIYGDVPGKYYGYIDDVIIYKKSDSGSSSNPQDPADDASDGELKNGDFETADTAWTITGGPFYDKNASASNNITQTMKINSPSSETDMSIKQKVKNLSAGTYKLSYRVSGVSGMNFALTAKVLDGDGNILASSSGVALNGWDNWIDASTGTFNVSANQTITVIFEGTVSTSFWGELDDVKLEPVEAPTRTFTFDTSVSSHPAVDSDLYLNKVDIMNDFITGFDVSSYVAIRKSGATFKDFDGNVLSDQGFFNLLAESGVNYIRIRVWVNPTDTNGNTYGGGACDLATAKIIGTYASNAGMKVLIDFHYSDFWTDPGKQNAPKEWAGLILEQKAATLQQYTEDSLTELIDADVNVGMVQVGNETTKGFCGETDWTNMCKLFEAGSQGIRNVEAAKNKKIMIAIHFTNPESGSFGTYAKTLSDNNVVYDVFATSYYPYWHGTLANLKSELSKVANTYDKYVMVAETSYVRTMEDGDGHENTETPSKTSDTFPYPVGIQGQITHVRNVIETVASIDNNKGIGVFYWEPAWIPVQVYDASASNAATVLAQNKALWERDGSGWATSYAGDYDSGAKEYYGGSAVDNEAVFDFDGTALESLKVYNMVRGGTTGEDYLVDVLDTSASFELGDDIVLPSTVTGVYASEDTIDVDVTWSAKDISEAEYSGEGVYPIDGVAVYEGEEYDVICTLTLVSKNYAINPSFENPLAGNWNTENISRKDSSNDNNNMKTGSYNLHYWVTSETDIAFYQTVTLDKGVYRAGGYAVGDTSNEYTIYVKVGDEEYSDTKAYGAWGAWSNAEVTDIEITEDGTEVTFCVRSNEKIPSSATGSWGAFEDFYIYKAADDVEYHIIEGANSTWVEDESGNVTIKSDGPFVKFVEVKVDGKTVASSNYTAKKGSTVITFLKSYLDTLDEGEHSVEIVFTNGIAKTNLTVVRNEEDSNTGTNNNDTDNTGTSNPTPATIKAPDNDGTGNTNSNNGVETGDTFELMLVIMLAVISAAGMSALYYANKKYMKSNKR
ncbi:MAG: glycosyl hydrolase 53 family protein [Lachnospiraceae bacterium]|nr:glycosyl hydrolase 53 family protein [Lachnospiraceae bacterium]